MYSMKMLLILVPVFLFSACQSDANNENSPLGEGTPVVKTKVESLKVSEICEFISKTDISRILGVNEGMIRQKPGTGSACIWTWMQNEKRQTLYLMTERNENPKKYAEKYDNFLNISLKRGEKRYWRDGTEEVIEFEKVRGFGQRAIWSDRGRILKWHYKNEFLFIMSIDPNNTINEAEKDFEHIKKLAKIINEGIE